MTDRVHDVDLLTGAYERARFEEEIARAVQAAHRTRTPLSLVYLDLDDLLEHNDLHGRERLDNLLGWVAERVSFVVDGRGPIGRLEGGAFAVLLPRTAKQEAEAIGERLCALVGGTSHASESGALRITVSIGVAELRASEPSGNLLEAAETACRHAKQAGRDTVVSR